MKNKVVNTKKFTTLFYSTLLATPYRHCKLKKVVDDNVQDGKHTIKSHTPRLMNIIVNFNVTTSQFGVYYCNPTNCKVTKEPVSCHLLSPCNTLKTKTPTGSGHHPQAGLWHVAIVYIVGTEDVVGLNIDAVARFVPRQAGVYERVRTIRAVDACRIGV